MNLRWHNPAKAAATRPSSSAPISSEVGRCGAGGCGASGKGGGEVLVVFEREGPCLSALVRVIRRRRQRRGYVLLYGGLPSGCVQEGAAAEEAPETDAGMDRAAKPLIQVPAGDALGERT